MSNIDYDTILARMNEPTKTASADAGPQTAHAALVSAAEQVKTAAAAAAAPPAADANAQLTKMAAETAALEEAAFLRQAKLAGAAHCDGFIERLAQYNQAATSTKTASADTIEQAFIAGFQAHEKQAADQQQAGFNAGIEYLHKTASEVHLAGQQSAANVLAALAEAS